MDFDEVLVILELEVGRRVKRVSQFLPRSDQITGRGVLSKCGIGFIYLDKYHDEVDCG